MRLAHVDGGGDGLLEAVLDGLMACLGLGVPFVLAGGEWYWVPREPDLSIRRAGWAPRQRAGLDA